MKRIINATSALAQKFGDLHDSGDYDNNRGLYSKIYDILEKYGTEDDKVDVVFDRASKEDQSILMDLAQKVQKKEEIYITKAEVQQKFNQLFTKYERGHTSEYEDGYFEALQDADTAFGLGLMGPF